MPGPCVLVVDDEAVNREIAIYWLEEFFAQADHARDGLEALALAGEKRYDLILMDLQMPRMDGLEASRRIRQLTGYRDVPILAITANRIDEIRLLCKAAGIDDVLAKPVSASLFKTAVGDWLALSGWLNTRGEGGN